MLGARCLVLDARAPARPSHREIKQHGRPKGVPCVQRSGGRLLVLPNVTEEGIIRVLHIVVELLLNIRFDLVEHVEALIVLFYLCFRIVVKHSILFFLFSVSIHLL